MNTISLGVQIVGENDTFHVCATFPDPRLIVGETVRAMCGHEFKATGWDYFDQNWFNYLMEEPENMDIMCYDCLLMLSWVHRKWK